jgi:diacylglycerol kinase (ATP)
MVDRGRACSRLRESAVTVFVNVVAGGGRARRRLAQMQKLFASVRVEAQLVLTNSAAELESSARNAVSEGRRALFAMGGDGTFQALVNAAYRADVLLGILPCGAGNDFAAALGLPDDPMKAAESVLLGSPRWVDLLRVSTDEGRTRLYAGGGGIGLDAEAAPYAGGPYRRFPGRSRYIASALRALLGFVPLDVRVEFPGSDVRPVEAKVLVAAVLNSPSYGAGLRLAPEATVDDGWLHLVLIEDLGALEIMRLLPRLMASGELRTSRVKRWRVKRVRLTTNRRCLFHGDGEIIGPTPVEVEVLPRAIQVLAPLPE